MIKVLLASLLVASSSPTEKVSILPDQANIDAGMKCAIIPVATRPYKTDRTRIEVLVSCSTAYRAVYYDGFDVNTIEEADIGFPPHISSFVVPTRDVSILKLKIFVTDPRYLGN